jgi:hypothetical protein
VRKHVLGLLLLAGAAFPYVVGVHVDPVQALWSGEADPRPDHGVAQTVTCNFDSLSYVELFAGAKGNGGTYTAIVYEGDAELTRSAGNGVPDHGWVKFSNWDQQVAFTKGKTVTIRFTRGGSDSVI